MFLFKQLFHINFGTIKDVINDVHKLNNKPRLFIFFDLMWCILHYKAGYTDYLFFDMYKLDRNERNKILTRGKNNTYVKKLNPKKYWDIMDNKALFDERFKKYLKRDFFYIDENEKDNFKKFKTFLKDKDSVIVKPLSASCGKGVEKIKVGEIEADSLYKKLIANKQFLLEEVATQHKDMAKLHKESINTIRLVTIHNKYDVTTIVVGICRIGTNHNVVDNFNSGGICAPIDVKTGKINGVAVDKQGRYYTTHPTTNIKIEGYQIPKWNEITKLVIDAANEIKELGIIGWDVCVGEKEPSLIEANQYPGYDLYKLIKTENNIGMVAVFEEAVNKTK